MWITITVINTFQRYHKRYLASKMHGITYKSPTLNIIPYSKLYFCISDFILVAKSALIGFMADVWAFCSLRLIILMSIYVPVVPLIPN